MPGSLLIPGSLEGVVAPAKANLKALRIYRFGLSFAPSKSQQYPTWRMHAEDDSWGELMSAHLETAPRVGASHGAMGVRETVGIESQTRNQRCCRERAVLLQLTGADVCIWSLTLAVCKPVHECQTCTGRENYAFGRLATVDVSRPWNEQCPRSRDGSTLQRTRWSGVLLRLGRGRAQRQTTTEDRDRASWHAAQPERIEHPSI